MNKIPNGIVGMDSTTLGLMMVIATVYGPNEDTLRNYCGSISDRDALSVKVAPLIGMQGHPTARAN